MEGRKGVLRVEHFFLRGGVTGKIWKISMSAGEVSYYRGAEYQSRSLVTHTSEEGVQGLD